MTRRELLAWLKDLLFELDGNIGIYLPQHARAIEQAITAIETPAKVEIWCKGETLTHHPIIEFEISEPKWY